MDEYLMEKMGQVEAEKLSARIDQISRNNTLKKKYKEGQFLTEDCWECGEDLPLERKEYGLLFCTRCQGNKERREKLFGK